LTTPSLAIQLCIQRQSEVYRSSYDHTGTFRSDKKLCEDDLGTIKFVTMWDIQVWNFSRVFILKRVFILRIVKFRSSFGHNIFLMTLAVI
jgi:hypothetical protein